MSGTAAHACSSGSVLAWHACKSSALCLSLSLSLLPFSARKWHGVVDRCEEALS